MGKIHHLCLGEKILMKEGLTLVHFRRKSKTPSQSTCKVLCIKRILDSSIFLIMIKNNFNKEHDDPTNLLIFWQTYLKLPDNIKIGLTK